MGIESLGRWLHDSGIYVEAIGIKPNKPQPLDEKSWTRVLVTGMFQDANQNDSDLALARAVRILHEERGLNQPGSTLLL